ncbi:hypothetical protein [Kineosporia sp. NBRC 101731]|uniref:hypothetical protein n=1 Tax=Kineosporia sp. NBRC 101731 TaxID=3032199 RepID=UPI0024A2C8A7|nr:hypothetical protein [Kineosporia sp. NBRC 101731]GLY31507.1 hypothetical protein Kisp02_48720 [Kineosporia sp. NBRC 101731]
MILKAEHPLAFSWRALLEVAGEDLHPEAKPWQLYPIGLAPQALVNVPHTSMPLIYAVPGNGWTYVGQTRQTLRARLAGHLRNPLKARTWAAIMVVELQPDISAARLDELESSGHHLLRPRTGERWPLVS